MVDPDDPFSVSPTDLHMLVGAISQTIDEDPVLAGSRLKLLARCGKHFGFVQIRDAVKRIVEQWQSLDWFNVILPGGGWRLWNEEYVVSLVISGNSSLLENARIERIDLRNLFRPVQNLPALSKEQRDAMQEFLCDRERRPAQAKWVPKFDETLFLRRHSGTHSFDIEEHSQHKTPRNTHIAGDQNTSNVWLGPLFDQPKDRPETSSYSTLLSDRIKSKWGPLFDFHQP